MKKVLSVLLVLTVAATIVLVGCRRETRDVITVGFAQAKSDESDWRMAHTRSMQRAFDVPGFRLILADSDNDAARQLADVQGFIDQDVDYIVIAAVNMDGWEPVLRRAQEAQIPVILVDRNINVDEDLFVTYIGPDFQLEGEMATEGMERHFGDRPVNIVHLQGQLGAGAQVGRSAALDNAIAANANWNLIARQTGNWSTDVAKQITDSWIQQFRDAREELGVRFNVVYAENDNMADGAIQALLEAGIRVGRDDGVFIVSFDANRPFLQMTLEGLININVECNPLHGPAVFDAIQMIERGETPPKWIMVEEEAFFWYSITQEIIDAREY